MTLDYFLVIVAVYSSIFIRLENIPDDINLHFLKIYSSPFIALLIFYLFGLYNEILRYIDLKFILTLLKTTLIFSLLWALFVFYDGIDGFPRSVIIINWAIVFFLIGSSRFFAKWYLSNSKNLGYKRSVLIYGAGISGIELTKSIENIYKFHVVAYIDDDPKKQGRKVNNIRVMPSSHIQNLIKKYNVNDVFIAIPSISIAKKSELISKFDNLAVHVKSLPKISELVEGKITYSSLREINLNELLERKEVVSDNSLMSNSVMGKVVCISGAGGSIGSELVRQIKNLKPKAMVLIENSEFALYKIYNEINSDCKFKVSQILIDVTNTSKLTKILEKFHVQTFFHTAAYKHVPIVEFNILEGINNNIFGTLSCVKAATKSRVESFVFISSDKAVRPPNLMGATKRFAEIIIQSYSSISDTKFTIVRFGNVIGSSGSVIPLFREQIKNGGPVTVTSKDTTRFLMTIPEAAQLVLQTGSLGSSGDIFFLDMGEPVSIDIIARKMINLSGYSIKDDDNPNGDIEIKYTGMRPGEKMHEELNFDGKIESTVNPYIIKVSDNYTDWKELEIDINNLKKSLENLDISKSLKTVMKVVENYKPQNIVDPML